MCLYFNGPNGIIEKLALKPRFKIVFCLKSLTAHTWVTSKSQTNSNIFILKIDILFYLFSILINKRYSTCENITF